MKFDTPKLAKAYDYASIKHKGQFRKISGNLYITHPERVYRLVRLVDDFDQLGCAALLHDVVEDCYSDSITQLDLIREIENKFGSGVKRIVCELTNVYTKQNYPNWDRKKRKEAELRRIRDISTEAKLIKCADRIDNILNYKINNGLEHYYINESYDLYNVLKNNTSAIYLETILGNLVNDRERKSDNKQVSRARTK